MTADIKAALVNVRRAKGLPLREVARRADTPPSNLHGWEHGTKDPTLRNLIAWAYALGYSVDLTPIAAPSTDDDAAAVHPDTEGER